MSAYTALRSHILTRLGGRCVHCGFTDARALQIDHVYSDGADERREYGGITYLTHILAEIESGRYQILCGNCNYLKRFDHMEDGRRFKLDAISDLDAMTLGEFM